MAYHSHTYGGGGGGSGSGGGVLMVGSHKVTSLEDVSRYSDSLLSVHFQALGDGRAEANEIQQGLKSESEIAAYTLDETLVGVDRLRFFLFHKSATTIQRQVGLAAVMKEVCTNNTERRKPHTGAHTHSEGDTSSTYTLTLSGAHILDSLLPDLQRHVLLGSWEWDLQTKVARLYTELLDARLLTRARVESVVAPFLMRMLDGSSSVGVATSLGANSSGDDCREEHLAVWMPPFRACIDALAVCTPHDASSTTASVVSPRRSAPASPLRTSLNGASTDLPRPSSLLTGSILDLSLKKGTQYLLSQPVHVRVMCVHVWGHLARHLDARLLVDRVLDSVLALCQDTAAVVRMHMCRHIVDIVKAIARPCTHASQADVSHSHSGVSLPPSCPQCPPPLVVDGSLDSSHPLCRLLSEVEELLKDEERDVKVQAFHTLVHSLDAFPDALRRARCLPLLRGYVQIPPKGMTMVVAANFGQILLQLKQDLLPSPSHTHADDSRSYSHSHPHAHSPSRFLSSPRVDPATTQIVKTLIAFYKNLPFLSATSAPELAPPLSPPASSASAAAVMTSPTSAANAAAALMAHISSEPRRHCAINFVAVLSILGRVPLSVGAASAAAARSAVAGPSAASPLVLESRFFLDHLAGLWQKLLKDDFPEVRDVMAACFFEVVTCLAGVGSTITRDECAAAGRRAVQGIGPTSAFRLTKDAFLDLLHEGMQPTQAASSTSLARGVGPTQSSPRTSGVVATSPAFDSLQHLLAEDKLQAIVDVYYANHFGSPGDSASVPPTDAVLESWSSFMHDLLRSLVHYDAAIASSYQWRPKLRLVRAIRFMIHPPPTLPLASTLRSVIPRASSPSVSPPRCHYFGDISNLRSLGDLNNYSLVWEKLLPSLLHHMHASPAPLKRCASDLLLTAMLCTPFAMRRSDVHQRLVREFATSRSYADRMQFVEIARRVLGVRDQRDEDDSDDADADDLARRFQPPRVSRRLFKKLFFLPLVALAGDPVSNVRERFIRTPLLDHARRMLSPLPADAQLHEAWSRALLATKTTRDDAEEPDAHTPDSARARPFSFAEEAADRACEAAEDALLRAEESWFQDDRHRSAFSMSGGHLSFATAALQSASNYTPLSEKSANASTSGAGAGVGTADSKSKLSKRASHGAASLKSLQEHVESSTSAAAAAARRRSFNPDAMTALNAGAKSSLSGTAAAANSQVSFAAQQAAALAASRVAAMNKSNKLKSQSALAAAATGGAGPSPPTGSSSQSGAAAASINGSAAATPKVIIRRHPPTHSAASAATTSASMPLPNVASSSSVSLAPLAGSRANRVNGATSLEVPSAVLAFGAAAEDDDSAARKPLRRAGSAGTGPIAGIGAATAGVGSVVSSASSSSSSSSSLSASGVGRVRPSAVAVRGNKLLSANLSLSAARIVASSGGSSTPSPDTSPLPSASRTLSAVIGAGTAVGAGRTASPAPTMGRPRAGLRIGSGSTSDRSGDREPSSLGLHSHSNSFSVSASTTPAAAHSQTAAALLHHQSMDQHSLSSIASRRVQQQSRASTPSGILPKLDSPSGVGGVAFTFPSGSPATSPLHSSSHSVSHGGTSSSALGLGLAHGVGVASTKLYSKEPAAHAHLRKFKLSQRSQLPTAEALRYEASSLSRHAEESHAVTPPPTIGAQAMGTGTGGGHAMHLRRRSQGGSFGGHSHAPHAFGTAPPIGRVHSYATAGK